MRLHSPLYKRLIQPVADIGCSDLIILPVKTSQHRLVVPLEIMNADQLRNSSRLLHKITVCPAALLLGSHRTDTVSQHSAVRAAEVVLTDHNRLAEAAADLFNLLPVRSKLVAVQREYIKPLAAFQHFIAADPSITHAEIQVIGGCLPAGTGRQLHITPDQQPVKPGVISRPYRIGNGLRIIWIIQLFITGIMAIPRRV
ncbi:hypothetical protein D3C80_1526200 [compost metagenome]